MLHSNARCRTTQPQNDDQLARHYVGQSSCAAVPPPVQSIFLERERDFRHLVGIAAFRMAALEMRHEAYDLRIHKRNRAMRGVDLQLGQDGLIEPGGPDL